MLADIGLMASLRQISERFRLPGYIFDRATPDRRMDKRLLTILRCPVTHKGLTLARSATVHSVNAAIASGSITNRDGKVLHEVLSEALITDDGKVLYPVVNGIPVLLESEAVNMEQLG